MRRATQWFSSVLAVNGFALGGISAEPAANGCSAILTARDRGGALLPVLPVGFLSLWLPRLLRAAKLRRSED